MPITRIGICSPRSLTKSNLPVPDQRIQAARGELADLRFQREHLARGEHPRQQVAVDVVDRRILENQCARRYFHTGLDDLEERAATRDERLVVDDGLVDVIEAAQCVEVVLLVVVQRCLLPEPGEHRIRDSC